MALADLPLLQAADMTMLGSFDITGSSFAYGGYGMSFDPAGNSGAGSLYLGGPDPAIDGVVRVGQISIPSLSGTASVLTAPTTVPNVGPLDRVGGTLVHNNRLIVSGFIYYDNGPDPAISHWRSTDKTVGNLGSPVKVGTLNAAFYGGYMGLIPAEWQDALGGPCFTGQGSLSIIGRTSHGTALFAFDPDQIGVTSPVPAQPLIYYPSNHTLGGEAAGHQSSVWNGTTVLAGCFFPPGTRSVCFVGRQGTGLGGGISPNICYGITVENGGTCVDPVVADEGYHAYPYVHQVWAYDALDLKAVKDGTLEPWECYPYDIWGLAGIGTVNAAGVCFGGLAYDPSSRRIYINRGSPAFANFGGTPLVTVWEHSDFSGGVPPSPTPAGSQIARALPTIL